MPISEATPADLARFKAVVMEGCGFTLEEGREVTLKTALKQRMAALCLASYSAYHAALLADAQEFNQLVELLTVNETYFFREPDHLKLAIDSLLPEIMKERDGPYRILSAGCSTGEEPYSVAIMLRERYGYQCEHLFSIVGVDIDGGVIRAARNGVFGRNSFRGVESELIKRHFESQGGQESKIRASTGRLVRFEAANLLGTFYPHVMHLPDIIFYRNVSIYFQEQVQQEIFRRLAGLLRTGGYLIVGATETMHHDVGILPRIERNGLFIFRKPPEFTIAERRATRREGGAASRPLQPPPPARPQVPCALVREPLLEMPFPGPKLSQPDSRRRFDDALEKARTGRGKEALLVLKDLLRQDSTFIKAHTLKAAILLTESRFLEARQACLAALVLDPLTLEACLMLGVIARNEGDNEAAHQRFREAIYLDGTCWMAHFYLAEILAHRGESRRAKTGYETALRILGDVTVRDRSLFPLSYQAEPFQAICRHKLSQLEKNG